MSHILETSKITPALAAAQRTLDIIDTGRLFSADADDIAASVAAYDRLVETLGDAMRELAEATRTDSPFLRYRKVILAREELQQLVRFLFGDDRLSFFHLFSSTTPTETAIALRCIAHYSEHGENDPHFMNLAAEIFDLRKLAA